MLGRLIMKFKKLNGVKTILWFLLFLAIIITLCEFLWVDFVKENNDSIVKIHAAGIMILTVILILVA